MLIYISSQLCIKIGGGDKERVRYKQYLDCLSKEAFSQYLVDLQITCSEHPVTCGGYFKRLSATDV